MKHIVLFIIFFPVFTISIDASQPNPISTKSLSSSSLLSLASTSSSDLSTSRWDSFRNLFGTLTTSSKSTPLPLEQRLRILSIAKNCQSATQDNNPTLTIECETIPEKILREMCFFYKMQILGSVQYALFVAYQGRVEKLSQGAEIRELDLDNFIVITRGPKMQLCFKKK